MKFSTLVRNILSSITICAAGLGLLAASGQAQNTQSKVQKQNTLTQSSAKHRSSSESRGATVSTPEGPGSVSGAPHLPAGFADTFTSRYVDIGGLQLHAVIGGKGRPLLLVHGWPQTWYQWRLVMPALAQDFQVIAVDQRGIGLSDKPQERLRLRHPSQRPCCADGCARPQAFCCSRLRYGDAHRLCPRC